VPREERNGNLRKERACGKERGSREDPCQRGVSGSSACPGVSTPQSQTEVARRGEGPTSSSASTRARATCEAQAAHGASVESSRVNARRRLGDDLRCHPRLDSSPPHFCAPGSNSSAPGRPSSVPGRPFNETRALALRSGRPSRKPGGSDTFPDARDTFSGRHPGQSGRSGSHSGRRESNSAVRIRSRGVGLVNFRVGERCFRVGAGIKSPGQKNQGSGRLKLEPGCLAARSPRGSSLPGASYHPGAALEGIGSEGRRASNARQFHGRGRPAPAPVA
jgi:hypothetical protein